MVIFTKRVIDCYVGKNSEERKGKFETNYIDSQGVTKDKGRGALLLERGRS